MTATQSAAVAALQKLAADHAAELVNVRAEYASLSQATRLMRRNGAASIEEAFTVEAKQRVLRNQWAQLTSQAA